MINIKEFPSWLFIVKLLEIKDHNIKTWQKKKKALLNFKPATMRPRADFLIEAMAAIENNR